MNLTAHLLTDQTEWENFVRSQNPHSFLHSWTWGEHHAAGKEPCFRVGIYQDEQLVGAFLWLKISARRGTFLFCPHGPVGSESVPLTELLECGTTFAIQLAKQEHCDFIRISPLVLDTVENRQAFKRLGFRPAPIHMHPELAWMLNLAAGEDELLKEMRKTTRYLIRKSEKEGVEVTSSSNPDDIETFWPVYLETVRRQRFTPFPKAYLRREFELFAKQDQIRFFFARYQGEVVAAAIIVFYGSTAFYHHSGSIQRFEKLNTTYLLQWRVIQEAKSRGCQIYNFWGISPDDRPKHPWAGLSLFKKGFGGYAEAYAHAQDKIVTTKYWLNLCIETARRIKRGV